MFSYQSGHNTIHGKSSAVQHFHSFCGFSHNFLVMALLEYDVQIIDDDKAKTQSFPYILIKSNEPQNFCTVEILSFTVYLFV